METSWNGLPLVKKTTDAEIQNIYGPIVSDWIATGSSGATSGAVQNLATFEAIVATGPVMAIKYHTAYTTVLEDAVQDTLVKIEESVAQSIQEVSDALDLKADRSEIPVGGIISITGSGAIEVTGTTASGFHISLTSGAIAATGVTEGRLAEALANYTTTSGLTTLLGGYATVSGLSDYTTTSGLTTLLGDYTTTSGLTTLLGGYATVSGLSDYTTTSGLTTVLEGYATVSGLSSTSTRLSNIKHMLDSTFQSAADRFKYIENFIDFVQSSTIMTALGEHPDWSASLATIGWPSGPSGPGASEVGVQVDIDVYNPLGTGNLNPIIEYTVNSGSYGMSASVTNTSIITYRVTLNNTLAYPDTALEPQFVGLIGSVQAQITDAWYPHDGNWYYQRSAPLNVGTHIVQVNVSTTLGLVFTSNELSIDVTDSGNSIEFTCTQDAAKNYFTGEMATSTFTVTIQSHFEINGTPSFQLGTYVEGRHPDSWSLIKEFSNNIAVGNPTVFTLFNSEIATYITDNSITESDHKFIFDIRGRYVLNGDPFMQDEPSGDINYITINVPVPVVASWEADSTGGQPVGTGTGAMVYNANLDSDINISLGGLKCNYVNSTTPVVTGVRFDGLPLDTTGITITNSDITNFSTTFTIDVLQTDSSDNPLIKPGTTITVTAYLMVYGIEYSLVIGTITIPNILFKVNYGALSNTFMRGDTNLISLAIEDFKIADSIVPTRIVVKNDNVIIKDILAYDENNEIKSVVEISPFDLDGLCVWLSDNASNNTNILTLVVSFVINYNGNDIFYHQKAADDNVLTIQDAYLNTAAANVILKEGPSYTPITHNNNANVLAPGTVHVGITGINFMNGIASQSFDTELMPQISVNGNFITATEVFSQWNAQDQIPETGSSWDGATTFVFPIVVAYGGNLFTIESFTAQCLNTGASYTQKFPANEYIIIAPTETISATFTTTLSEFPELYISIGALTGIAWEISDYTDTSGYNAVPLIQINYTNTSDSSVATFPDALVNVSTIGTDYNGYIVASISGDTSICTSTATCSFTDTRYSNTIVVGPTVGSYGNLDSRLMVSINSATPATIQTTQTAQTQLYTDSTIELSPGTYTELIDGYYILVNGKLTNNSLVLGPVTLSNLPIVPDTPYVIDAIISTTASTPYALPKLVYVNITTGITVATGVITGLGELQNVHTWTYLAPQGLGDSTCVATLSGGSGTGAQSDQNFGSDGAITRFTLFFGGQGYKVGDLLTLEPVNTTPGTMFSTNGPATVTVTSVNH